MPPPRRLAFAPVLMGLALVVAGLVSPGPAQAQAIYSGALDAASANPPTGSPGTGTAEVAVDEDQLEVDLAFSGLLATATASHIHCCATPPTNVGVAVTFVGFPTGVTSGTYAHTFDLDSSAIYTAAFINGNGGTVLGARLALLNGLRDGRAYTCVHTTVFPGGEIRSYFAFESFADGFETMDTFDWSSTVP